MAAAEQIGYPVVLKLNSETVTHKSDRGGVHLNLKDASAVRSAFAQIQAAFASDGSFQGVTVQPMVNTSGYELILGSSTDPQFGPVLVFGLGGQLVEVLRDNAHALPPLTTTLARRMMENTRILQALKGVRGRKPVDLEKLEELLVRFSELVVENPRIADIEINPLLASDRRFCGAGRQSDPASGERARCGAAAAGDPSLSQPVHFQLANARWHQLHAAAHPPGR